MRPKTFLLAVMGLLLFTASPSVARLEARAQQAPSSRVELKLPEGFIASRQFSGFVDEARGTSIVIVEMPADTYEQVVRGLAAGALAASGITRPSPGTLDRPAPYYFVHAEQTSGNQAFIKYMLAFRDGDVAALVTANVEKSAIERKATEASEIEAILASARVAPTPAPPRDVFALGYTGSFRLAGTILGTTRIYTLDGRLETAAKGDERATVVVAPSLDLKPVAEPDAYSEKLLDGLPGLGKVVIESKTQLVLNGMNMVEIVGRAKDRDGGHEVAIYQALLLPASGGYFRIVGQLPLGERARLLAELRQMTASLRPRL